MLEFIRKLFSSDFMPHGMCFLWNRGVLWLNVVSDILIAISYYAIPFLLFRFARRRRDISFKAIFVAFGVFILACGTTHVIGAVTVWTPVYRLEGVVKLITALASITTFAMLVPMMPTLVALPSQSELARVNSKLALEIEERRAAEDQVRRINEDLEDRVAKRTAERRALEDQLIQSQKMEAIGRLAGGVAHDFNNLLTVIVGYNDMIREQVQADPECREFAEEIQRAAERATALTNQLLAFSRQQAAVPRVVDLNEIVRNMDKMLRRLIGEDIALEDHLAAGLPPVRVDPSHMDQVILNLAINARDAMPLGGKLIIETSSVEVKGAEIGWPLSLAPGGYAVLSVRDTGVGMDEATRARAFEPFFTTKDKGKGTGLGLSIVYGIIKQNGGEITIESEPHRGAAFRIYLPTIDAKAEPLAQEAELPETSAGGETILLVEDEEQVRSLTHTILVRNGYRVLQASSVTEALTRAAAHQGPIDLLLTDVVMPESSGVDLAHEIQDTRPGTRVLYMSGYIDNKLVSQDVLDAGAQFLQKPFSSSALRRKVREALEHT